MANRVTSVRSREIGAGLRPAMDRAGLDAQWVAEELTWSRNRISVLGKGKPIESGYSGRRLFRSAEQDGVRRVWRGMHRPGWWRNRAPEISAGMRAFVGEERNAILRREFQASLIPDLLRTPDYSRAVLEKDSSAPVALADPRVLVNLARQEVLGGRRGCRFSFLVHESALRAAVGGSEVMFEQRRHLLRLGARANVAVRVVPGSSTAARAHAGSFVLLEFAGTAPAIYRDAQRALPAAEVPGHRVVARELTADALSRQQSREFITWLACR